MNFNENQIATYLFCAQLPDTKTLPLTILEWNTLVSSISKKNQEPKILITATPSEIYQLLDNTKSSQRANIVKKIESRQQLGLSLVEMENVINQNIQIIFRSDIPKKLKKLTSKYLPPFFYAIGDLSIFQSPTLGVVGSRNANEKELECTKKIGMEAANKGFVIVSGGAKGVDTAAVDSCLLNKGKAIVFPSDGLQKWIQKKSTRNFILNGQLLMLSSQQINAPFTGRYAMQRNKFIHASGDFVIVTSSSISGTKKSGTWEGVMENVQAKWSPIFVTGESTGVLRLVSDGHATPFTSFEQITQHTNPKLENINSFDFAQELETLINNAKRHNISPQQIQQIIKYTLEELEEFNYINKNNQNEKSQQLRLL